jgi:hypothetical protein
MSHCDDCSGYEGSCLHCKYNASWVGYSDNPEKERISKEAHEDWKKEMGKIKPYVPSYPKFSPNPIKFGKKEKDPLIDILERSNK